MANSVDWLHLDTFPPTDIALPETTRFLDTWKICFTMQESQCSGDLHHINQTMNTHFLSPLQCVIVLTDSIWTRLHPWEMLYHTPEGSSTPGKTVLPWRQVNVLVIFLDKTTNTHFLSPLQWHTVPTGSNQIPVHPWNMLYQGPQGSSTPGKPALS